MTDKTAAELVSDFVRNETKISENSLQDVRDGKTPFSFSHELYNTRINILKEMKEWYDENINKDNFIDR